MEFIFDTHAHYDDPAFDADRFDFLKDLQNYGIKGIVNVGADIKTSQLGTEYEQISMDIEDNPPLDGQEELESPKE